MEERENGMRIAVLGDRESTVGFAALGYTVCEAADVAAAERVLLSLVADPRYALIFLTEEYAAALTPVTDRYRDRAIPAIVPIPAAAGTAERGFAMKNLHRAVERAVGADVLQQK